MQQISQIVAKPILDRPIKFDIWTGVVSLESINQYLISDEEKRKIFKSLVAKYEKKINEYRRGNNVLLSGQNTSVLEGILKLSDEIRKMLDDLNNENAIDMDLFWISLLNRYEVILEKNPDEFLSMKDEYKKLLKDLKKIIDKEGMIIREKYFKSLNKYMVTSFPTMTQAKKYKKEDNPKKLIELVRAIVGKDDVSADEGLETLEKLLVNLHILDFFIIFPNENYAKNQYFAFFKNYLLNIGYTFEQVQKMNNEDMKKIVFDTYETQGLEYQRKFIPDVIKNGIYNVDFEKMLLIAVTRHLEMLNSIKVIDVKKGDIPKEHIHDHDEVITRNDDIEQMLRKILELKLISNSTKITIDTNGKKQKITRNIIEQLMNNFCDGLYITEQLVKTYKNKAFFMKNEMATWSDEFVQRIDFTETEATLLSLINFDNLKRLYEFGKVNKTTIISMLAMIEDGTLRGIVKDLEETQSEYKEEGKDIILNTSNFLRYLVDEQILSFSELKECYDKRIIKMGDLEKLDEGKTSAEQAEFRKQFGEQINEIDLLKAYKEYIEYKVRYEKMQKENSPDIEFCKTMMEQKRKEKDSELLIYKKYKLTDLSPEQRNEKIDEMLLYYCLEMNHDDETVILESLREMYKDGFIKFENISNLGQTYLQTVIIDMMFVRGELTLEDTQKLRDALPLETLIGIVNRALANSEITQTQKFSLIRNIFHRDINDDEIAKLFLQKLNAQKYEGVQYDEILKIKEKNNLNEINEVRKSRTYNSDKKYIYPQYVKWGFLQALDKDANITVYANGYVEVYSKKLNVRIIEKYFEVDKKGCNFGKDAYGHSTFIVEEHVYRENLDLLVDNYMGKEPLLNRKTLVTLVPSENRVRHNTQSSSKNWMRAMAKYFDIDLESDINLINDSRYTKEELENIRNVIKIYENEYIEIDKG